MLAIRTYIGCQLQTQFQALRIRMSVCVSQVFGALKDRQSTLQDRFFSGLTSWTFSPTSDCK
jgi:hypothetical protein